MTDKLINDDTKSSFDAVFYRLEYQGSSKGDLKYEFKGVSKEFIDGLMEGNNGRTHYGIKHDCKSVSHTIEYDYAIGIFEGGIPFTIFGDSGSESGSESGSNNVSDDNNKQVEAEYKSDPIGTINKHWKQFLNTHEEVAKPTMRYTCVRYAEEAAIIYEFDNLDFLRGLINAISIRDKERRYKEGTKELTLFDNYQLCKVAIDKDNNLFTIDVKIATADDNDNIDSICHLSIE